MNALPRYDYPPPPERVRRRAVRRRPRQNPHQVAAIEIGFKLGVNCILAIVATSALLKLVPYNLAQQTKLQEIRTEVSEIEDRVGHLQADLNRQFDPQQAMSVMQEESIRVDPRQRQIVWLSPASSTAQRPASTSAETALGQEPSPAANSAVEPAFYPPAQ
jgi:hypothetical protein